MTRPVYQAPADGAQKVRIWDAPVRVFHWLLALCFAGAYATSESETWRLLHVTLGYTLGGLIVFRLVWGVVGTRYARFSQFVRGPRAVAHYLRSLVGRKPQHHLGHNPAGAWAIVGLLVLGAALVTTGWGVYNDVGPQWLPDLHEAVANAMLLLVGVHVLGVLVSSWLHRDNLVRAMVTGRKHGTVADAIESPWRPIAVVVLASVLGFWWFQWHSAPVAVRAADGTASSAFAAPSATATALRKNDHDKDDD